MNSDVTRGPLYRTSPEWDAASLPEILAVSNGCGPHAWKMKLDRVFGTATAWPCLEHDFTYHIGGTERDRWRGDWRFLRNMLTDAWLDRSAWIVLRAPVACVFYATVVIGGWMHFNYVRPSAG